MNTTSNQPASTVELQDRNNPHHVETRRRARGKIANLPKAVRDRINQMLYDGFPYADIIKAVSDVAPGLNEDNLSRWYNGQYLRFQEHAERMEDERDKTERLREYINQINSPIFQQASRQLISAQLWEVVMNFDPVQLGNYLMQNPQCYLRVVDVLLKLSEFRPSLFPLAAPAEPIAQPKAPTKTGQSSCQPNQPCAPNGTHPPRPTPSMPSVQSAKPTVPTQPAQPARSTENRPQPRSIADNRANDAPGPSIAADEALSKVQLATLGIPRL